MTDRPAADPPVGPTPEATPGDRTTAKARPPLDEEVVVDGELRALDDLDAAEVRRSPTARRELEERFDDQV